MTLALNGDWLRIFYFGTGDLFGLTTVEKIP